MEENEKEAILMQLVMGLQSSAWMLLGKVANPITGKLEKNLAAVKSTVDTLIMLKEKMQGNLSKVEEDYLDNTISQLQLNYVEETNKKEEVKEEPKEEVKEEPKEEKKEEEKTEEKEECKDKGCPNCH